MNTLTALALDELVKNAQSLVREERRIGLEVLEHLREIERRRAFVDRGHSSLFVFCLRELGYNEPQAQLRIDAMRAMRDTPQIEERVRSGELPVTAVVKVQQFLRREKVRTGVAYPLAARVELFERVEGKSTREIERELIAISPLSALPQGRERGISASHSGLRLVIPEALRGKLETLKALFSHRMGDDPNSTVALLEILAADALKRAERSGRVTGQNDLGQDVVHPAKSEQSVAPIAPEAPEVAEAPEAETPEVAAVRRSRFIPAQIQRAVWARGQGRCAYRDPRTGQACESRRYLQIDHRVPFSRGGTSHDPAQLRALCGRHQSADVGEVEGGVSKKGLTDEVRMGIRQGAFG